MKSSTRLIVGILILGAGGAALFVSLLLHHGIKEIGAAMEQAGWWMAVIIALHSLPLLLDANAWRYLFPRKNRLPLKTLWWMRWVGESVTNLLPGAQIGGDLVRARLVNMQRVPMAASLASVLADITISIFTEIAFVLSGVALLAKIT